MRGIRKLEIDLKKGNFAISGPNGSGKSGVIDAIEFGLTGQTGRLTGRGTKTYPSRNTALMSTSVSSLTAERLASVRRCAETVRRRSGPRSL